MLSERSPIDRGPLRRQLLADLDDGVFEADHAGWWSRGRLLMNGDALIAEIVQQIADIPGLAGPAELSELTAISLLEVMRDHFGVDGQGEPGVTRLAPSLGILVGRASGDACARYRERIEQDLPSSRLYALELGFVGSSGKSVGSIAV